VLEETGGIADHFEDIISIMNKDTGAIVRYDSDPETLLDELEYVYEKQILPRLLKAIKGHDPDGTLEA